MSATNIAIVTANPTVTTIYTLTVTDGCNTITTSSVTITVFPNPAVLANSTSTVICNGNSITLTGSGATTYSWTGGVTDGLSFMPPSSITYTVTGTDGNGCTNSSSIAITVNSLPTVSATAANAAICTGSSTTVTGSGALTYSWDFGGVNATETVMPTVMTTYTVTGTDVNGCINTATVMVDVNPLPVVNIGNDMTQCGGSILLDAGNVGATYLWSDNSTSQTLSASTSGTYSVTVTDINGCVGMDAAVMTFNAIPTVNIGPNLTQCGSAILDAGNAGSTFLWNTAATTQTITVTTSGTYYVDVVDVNGCIGSDTIVATINANPTVTLALGTTAMCFDDGNLTLSGGSPAGGTFTGSGVSAGQFDPSVAGNGAQLITYSFTDINGCDGFATQTITVSACTGIHSTSGLDGVTIFPNPFTESISIHRTLSSEVTVNIFDAEGRLVMSKKAEGAKIEIATSELSNGIYSIQLVDVSGTKVYSITKGK